MIIKSISPSPVILLPVEKYIREFEGKVVLACHLATAGFRVVIADHTILEYIGLYSSHVIWMGKYICSYRRKFLSRKMLGEFLSKNSSLIIHDNDEGGMYQVSYWKEEFFNKHTIHRMRSLDLTRLFLWGSKQSMVIHQEVPELAGSTIVTGCPRIDISRPSYGWLSREFLLKNINFYSKYILLCTRFGTVTGKVNIYRYFQRKKSRRKWPETFSSSQIDSLLFTKWRQDVHDFAEFVFLTKELSAAYPDQQIILRPHPSESLIFYQKAFSNCSNIEVIREGNVLNWIRGAEIVIHCNCTTGIEAVLAEKPVLNFLPGDESRTQYDVEVAREAGVTTRTVNDALEMVGKILNGYKPQQTWSSHAKSILNNLEQDAIPILVKETIRVIQERGITYSRLALPPGSMAWGLLNRLKGRRPPKPGHFNLELTEKIIEGCRANGVGFGKLSHFSPQYVVIDPI